MATGDPSAPSTPPPVPAGPVASTTSSPAPAGGTTGATLPHPAARLRWWVVAGPVAVAIVVFLAVVLWGGGAPVAGSGSGVPFSRADAEAVAAVSAHVSGTWATVGVVGLDERSAASVSTSDLVGLMGSGCSVGPWNGTAPASAVVVPAFTGAFSSGLAPIWLVFLDDATSGALVLVEVLNGSATPLAEVEGSGCPVSSAEAHPLPTTTVDSPTVAAAAWSDDGSSWVSNDPALSSLTLAAFGGGKYSGIAYTSLWAVIYSPCDPLLGGSTEEPIFVATFDLTSGALTLAFSYHLDCPA